YLTLFVYLFSANPRAENYLIPVVLFCNAATTTAIYPLSLHDALPIFGGGGDEPDPTVAPTTAEPTDEPTDDPTTDEPTDEPTDRSEEHTSELQSRENLVCRLLLEKKKRNKNQSNTNFI